MAIDVLKNFAYSTVLTAPSPSTSGTSLGSQTGDGAKFPPGSFDLTLWPANSLPLLSNAEIVRATVTTDTFTIVRAQYGTTAKPVAVGYQMAQMITAAFIAEIIAGVCSSFNTRVGAVTLTAADVEALFTVKGQLLLGTGTNTGALLGIGTTGQVLTVSGATAVWAAAANLVNGSTTTTLTGLLSGNGSVVSSVTAPAGTVVGTTDTQTLTNKRVTKRVTAVSTNASTLVINSDNSDVVHVTSQTVGLTISATGGTPVDGDKLLISITGTAAVALSWSSAFEGSTTPLPSSTVGTARLDIGFIWNTETSKWRCVSTA